MNKININKIKEIILNNPNGFTLKLNNLKIMKSGYAVAITNRTNDKFISLDDNLNNLIELIQVNFSQIMNNLYIGGWYNKDNDKFYLDLTLLFNNKNNSLKFMSKFNQISLYNIKELKEIKNRYYKQ